MLDIKFIRSNSDAVRNTIAVKGAFVDLDRLLQVDELRREKLQAVEALRGEQNMVSEEVAKLSGADREGRIAAMKELKTRVQALEQELLVLTEEFDALMTRVPNTPLSDVPVGKSEDDNVVLREVGTRPQFDFEPKDHVALGEALDIIDIERAGKVAGARFSYLKREAALLEFALIQYALRFVMSEDSLRPVADAVRPGMSPKPFVPVLPPVMVRPDVFRKMARLTDADKDERYYLPSDDVYLIGSAEHTLGSLHMNERFSEEALPVRYVGFSTSFRREAGSYGKDTRGIFRVHQFDKLELESFTVSEDSLDEQNFFVAIQELLLQGLNIPYRVVMISTGDMGTPDARQIDIECWLPGQGRYRETHTADLMTDYQARRLNTKVKRNNGESEFVHTNDATLFAIGRTLIAIFENYQQADGSIRIPEALQPYMFGITEIRR